MQLAEEDRGDKFKVGGKGASERGHGQLSPLRRGPTR